MRVNKAEPGEVPQCPSKRGCICSGRSGSCSRGKIPRSLKRIFLTFSSYLSQSVGSLGRNLVLKIEMDLRAVLRSPCFCFRVDFYRG